jgi:hypothetical protein
MAILETGVRTLTRQMPKVISPRVHGFIDYGVAAGFFLGAILFWKRHKRAAIASLCCGAAELTTTLVTDFPAGVTDAISFETHGKIEAGLAATAGMVPTMLMFGSDPEAWFFRAQALGITGVAGVTEWDRPTSLEGDRPRRNRRAA